jgi:hypothetical protein
MHAKKTLGTALIVTLVAGAAGYILSRTPARAPKPSSPALEPTANQSAQNRVSVAASPAAPLPRAAAPPVPIESPPAVVANAEEAAPDTSAKKPSPKAKRPRRELKDPLSRRALALVGADRGAEAYWLAAINNKDLPAEERSDLIEDLNEDGISDPDNPGPEDLPLIINRLAVISRYAPFAMDQVNADAFQEAYKDLMTMYNQLLE